MDELGLKRYCCRRMIMTHVDLIEKLLKYVLVSFTRANRRGVTCRHHVPNYSNRYTPDGRSEIKQRLNELA